MQLSDGITNKKREKPDDFSLNFSGADKIGQFISASAKAHITIFCSVMQLQAVMCPLAAPGAGNEIDVVLDAEFDMFYFQAAKTAVIGNGRPVFTSSLYSAFAHSVTSYDLPCTAMPLPYLSGAPFPQARTTS